MNITFDAQGGREFGKLTEDERGPAHGHRPRRQRALGAAHQREDSQRQRPHHHGPRRRARLDERLDQEAQTLALVLKAGALPAPVTVGEIRQVGATLGDELIRKGSLAALVGPGAGGRSSWRSTTGSPG